MPAESQSWSEDKYRELSHSMLPFSDVSFSGTRSLSGSQLNECCTSMLLVVFPYGSSKYSTSLACCNRQVIAQLKLGECQLRSL